MIFEQSIKIPISRVGVLVGKGGTVKKEIENQCGVSIEINGSEGEVIVTGSGDVSIINPFKAIEIINAISKGFSPERASSLFRDDESLLDIIDLRDYSGRSRSHLNRIKGRIIGSNGKTRRVIEETSGSELSVYGHTVSIIGTASEVEMAKEAVENLASGKSHQNVYMTMQKKRSKAKKEMLLLWEGKSLN
tara:strand:+ start:65 stop:637 length:573 start_codon:yes stop_codon:yes gene_type:complete